MNKTVVNVILVDVNVNVFEKYLALMLIALIIYVVKPIIVYVVT